MQNKINVNIITGFLGVGKTTFIQNLLKHKPEKETWAVLVNEYGQQGIDGALLATPNIIVKQIAGGCACCAALMPFQIALNQLIRQENPHRMFIEPSGLGHVDKIVALLQEDQYQGHLQIKATICLVDPRQLSQPKYRYHELYLRQLNTADVLVASKMDLAQPQDIILFDKLVKETQKPSAYLQQGMLPMAVLDEVAQSLTSKFYSNQSNAEFFTEVLFFSANRWDIDKLERTLLDVGLMRGKGLFVHENKVIGINMASTECAVQEFALLNADQVSVLECIDDKQIDTLRIQAKIEACIEHD